VTDEKKREKVRKTLEIDSKGERKFFILKSLSTDRDGMRGGEREGEGDRVHSWRDWLCFVGEKKPFIVGSSSQ